MGDIVNTASRVEGLNKSLGTTLLATAAASESIGEVFARPLGRFQLAGKSQPLDIVELVSDATAPPAGSNYADFATALTAYHDGKLDEAAKRFAELAQRWPNDGPTQFFLAACQSRLQKPSAQPWNPTITIDQK